jgi:Disulphide bond corrector protein DsbC
MTSARLGPVSIATALFTLGGAHWVMAEPSVPNVQWHVSATRSSLELAALVPDGWHVYALHQAAGGPTPLLVTLDAGAAASLVGAPSGTAPETRHDPSFDLKTAYYAHAFTLSFPIKVRSSLANSPVLPVSVRFQLCSERECQPPKTVHLLAPIGAANSS